MPEAIIRTCILTEESAILQPPDYVLAETESILAAYLTYMGTAVFTDKRLIVQNVQGSSKKKGRKKESFSLRYSAVELWTLDNNSDLDYIMDFWLGAGFVRMIVKKAIDTKKIETILTQVLL
jgi:hypothetical protein